MVVDMARIAQLERELEEARKELWKEAGAIAFSCAKCRRMSETHYRGTDGQKERILFGLEPPEEPKGGAAMRAGASGGDLTCPICGKSGLTRGDWPCIPYGCMARDRGKSKVRRREKRNRVGPERRIANQCRLGPWTTRNADLAWSHHQEFPELKIVGVFAEHGIEVFDLGLKAGSRKTEENDAG